MNMFNKTYKKLMEQVVADAEPGEEGSYYSPHDDKYKIEISDDQAIIDFSKFSTFDNRTGLKYDGQLKTVFQHDLLYAKIPQAKELKCYFVYHPNLEPNKEKCSFYFHQTEINNKFYDIVIYS